MKHMHLRRTKSLGVLAAVCLTFTAISAIGQEPVPPVPGAPAAVLWRDPGPVSMRDLSWGIGDATRVPQGPFTLIEEDTSGTQPKIVVTDARGEKWDVKFGVEAHSEVAANRLVWALGYLVEELYFVREGTLQIGAANNLRRAADHIGPDSRFRSARFRRRHPHMERSDEEWTFHRNPFIGRRELAGLRILMTMINNWDIQNARNNKVLHVRTPDGSIERWFIVSDLGGTFGRMGGRLSGHSKWNLEDFQSEGFIEKVEKDEIHLDYDGLDSGMDRVPIDHARWFATLVSQLTPEQLRQAFEASGATPQLADGFSKKLQAKIIELRAALAR